MAGTRKLVIEILGNAKDAAQAFGDVRKHSDITKERLDKFGTAALGAGVAIAGGLAYAVKEFVAADEQSRKLDNSIKNSSQTFSRNGDAIRDLATKLQNLSGADGDALVGASALAVQWGLSESQIKQLLPLVNDLSLKMGQDVNTSMKAVLKATDGSTTALRKMGIQVDATKASGDPFLATMEALKGSVGGFGEEVGQTAGGKLNILKQQLGDLVEAVGGGAVDIFGPVVSGLTNFLNGAGPAGQAAGDIAGKVLAIGSAALIAVGGIVKIKGAFDNVKTALTDAEGNLNNFGRAAQAVGIIAGSIAILGLLDQLNQATTDSVGLKTAIDELAVAKGPAELQAAFERASVASETVADKISNALAIIGLGTDTYDPFAGMIVSVNGVDYGLSEIQRTLADLSKSGDTEGLSQAMFLLTKYTNGDKDAMAALSGILKPYQDAAKASTQRTKEQAGAHEEAANAADEQNAALKALIDPVFGAMRAEQQNTEAQKKAIDATAKVNLLRIAGKTNTADFAAALRDERAAHLDAGSAAVNTLGAYNTLSSAVKDGTVTTQAFNSTLGTLQSKAGLAGAATAGLSNEAGGLLIRAVGAASGVDDLGKAADRTNGKRAHVTVTADTSDAVQSIKNVETEIDRLVSKATNPNIPAVARDQALITAQKIKANRRASGGQVLAGHAYLIGERGPEVVVPGSGYVIPTRRLVDAQPGGSGGSSVTVNVTAGVGDPVAIGRQVVESLKAYERTNGTAWRN